jgi:adenylate kinase family enzyme
MVIGVSSGVGKSTFARKLSAALNIEVYHLDALYWKPGWAEAPLEEFAAAQKKIVCNDQWIIEGNYSNTFEIRVEQADTIFYLELPLLICLYRVIKRWFQNIGRTRSDMGEGCNEKIDWDFIKFICTTYYPRKRKMVERIQSFQELGKNKNVFIFREKQEIHSFFKDIMKNQ